eukprot:1279419-Heterocapsa_arctica.AAC.1
MVICHTGELAYQIKHEFERFAKYCQDVKAAVAYGGIPIVKAKEVLGWAGRRPPPPAALPVPPPAAVPEDIPV